MASETNIHPTAIIEDGALIAPGTQVGAYAYIGSLVKIGPNCTIQHHASVEGNTTLGEENEIFPYALIGGRTQDKKWAGDEAPAIIGDRNIFREFCTVHPATFLDGETRIGSDNLFCAYAHIGHECHVGSGCVFSNNATLGGHCEVGDRVVIGGLTAVHQFCHLGDGVMLGGCSRVTQDVLPFMIAEGHPATHRTINKVGLQRAGYPDDDLLLLKRIYKLFFRSGLNHTQAAEKLESGELGQHALIDQVLNFQKKSTRGLA